MSKVIKMTSQNLEEIRKDFDEALKKLKMSDGKINFTKTFGSIDRKATLYFTELAYLKMMTLVREFDKEVAWHGIAKRGEDTSKDEYVISDILVYPQEVTGATVNTDQEKYQMWLMNHEDDVFNNIRMQGHSHVNMGTTPSSVDNSLYERILDQLDDDMFYIFLIWNKRGEKTIKIYDLAKNVLFETSDVTIEVLDDGTGIEHFLKEAKEMVQNKTYTSTPTNRGNYGIGYSAYANRGYGSTAPANTAPPKKEDDDTAGTGGGVHTTGKKKKKKKKSGSSAYPISYGYDDDDDDYYSGGWYKEYYGRK